MGCIQSYRHRLLFSKNQEESLHILPAQIEELSAISVIELRSNTENPLIGKEKQKSNQTSEMILTQYITPDLNNLEMVSVQELEPMQRPKEWRVQHSRQNSFNKSIEKLRSRSFSDFQD